MGRFKVPRTVGGRNYFRGAQVATIRSEEALGESLDLGVKIRFMVGRLRASAMGLLIHMTLGVVIGLAIVVRPLVRIRFAAFETARIGEFITRLDMAVALSKQKTLQERSRRNLNLFFLPVDSCNEQLRTMYVRSLSAVQSVRLIDCRESLLGKALFPVVKRLRPLSSKKSFLRRFYCGEGNCALDTCGFRPSGRPLLSFSREEIDRGWELLSSFGIERDTPYICLHIRDQAYLKVSDPTRDWGYHNYRNPPIDSYEGMVKRVLDRGYSVVRMGRIVEGSLSIKHPRFIDYAVSEFRSDFLDVFLYAHACLTVSGGVSGIDTLGYAFNIPNVATNFVPFADPRWAIDDALVIPALLVDAQTRAVLPLSEMLRSRFTSTKRYKDAGIGVLANSDLEIIEAVEEGLDRLEGQWVENPHDLEIQRDFWSWAERCGLSDGIENGPWKEDFYRARLGTKFLKKNHEVLMN